MEIRQLTFLRFIAAFGVVLFHSAYLVKGLAWAQPFWSRANTGVSFFFVLSGFILAHVYSARGVARPVDFYVARLARIGPLYWLALVAMTVVSLRDGAFEVLDFVLSASLLQAFWPGHSQVLNAPGWSLSVELLFYLVFPFLLPRLLPKRTASLLTLAAVVWAANLALHVYLLTQATAHPSKVLEELLAYHPLTHLGTFVIGVCGGLVFRREQATFARFSPLLVWLPPVVLLTALWVPNPIVAYHHNGLFAPLFLAVLWGLGARSDTPLARLLSWSPLVLLGEASYGIYILQAPIYRSVLVIEGQLVPDMPPAVRFVVFVVTLLTASIICFRWLETPLRDWLKRKLTPARS